MDSRTRRDGREIERVGWYDPVQTDDSYEIKTDRIIHWLKEGAEPSDTVHNIFKKAGINTMWHMIQLGKSDEEIESAMTEWQSTQDALKAAKVAAQPKEQKTAEQEETETATPLDTKTTDTSEEEFADTDDENSVEDSDSSAE